MINNGNVERKMSVVKNLKNICIATMSTFDGRDIADYKINERGDIDILTVDGVKHSYINCSIEIEYENVETL